MTTASAITHRASPPRCERHLNPSMHPAYACGGANTRTRAFATCHLAGASTLRRLSREH